MGPAGRARTLRSGSLGELGPGDLVLADCPARLALELLADTWTAVTLSGPSGGPVRQGDLVEPIGGGISRTVLTHDELTAPGATLIDPIHVPSEWARANGDAVLDALDGEDHPVADPR